MFDFKSKCVYIEDLLTPYSETSNSSLDLKAIGIKENLFSEQNLANTEVICRLCFNAITEEKINLCSAIKKNKLEHVFEKNLTEVVSKPITQYLLIVLSNAGEDFYCLLTCQKI